MRNYNVTVELDRKDDPKGDGAAAIALVDALEGYSPAAGPSVFGRLEVVITVPAETLRQAVTTGLAVVEAAAGVRALAVDALATDDFDRRHGVEPMPELLGVTEAAALLNVSRQRVLQLVDAGTLPGRRVGSVVVIPASAVAKRVEELRQQHG